MPTTRSTAAAPKKPFKRYKPYIRDVPPLPVQKTPASHRNLFQSTVDAMMRREVPEACSHKWPKSGDPAVLLARSVETCSTVDHVHYVQALFPVSNVAMAGSTVRLKNRGSLATSARGERDFFPEAVKVASPPVEQKQK